MWSLIEQVRTSLKLTMDLSEIIITSIRDEDVYRRTREQAKQLRCVWFWAATRGKFLSLHQINQQSKPWKWSHSNRKKKNKLLWRKSKASLTFSRVRASKVSRDARFFSIQQCTLYCSGKNIQSKPWERYVIISGDSDSGERVIHRQYNNF